VPPPRDHLRVEKDGRIQNRAPAPQIPDRKPSQQIGQIVEPTPDQLESIKKFQVCNLFRLFFFSSFVRKLIFFIREIRQNNSKLIKKKISFFFF
jgi:hypothetical protein